MKSQHRFTRLAVAIALLIAACTGISHAQGRTEEAVSVGALLGEIRQLRQAVEEANRRQSQIQALGVYLSAQQGRIGQLGVRLDAIRTELTAAMARSQEAANLVGGAQKEAAGAMNAEERDHAAGMARMFKQQAAAAARREQELRDRESELTQAFAFEEARWQEAIARLEQTVKQ